ncbi:MAG: hypothetical protein ACFB2W_17080 [Leptolyngbyaceae cyanobacterium]
MPFLPLFIVIGLFLATSKLLQPSSHQSLRPVSEDYDEKLLNQALINYIARESKHKTDTERGSKNRSKAGKTRSKSFR